MRDLRLGKWWPLWLLVVGCDDGVRLGAAGESCTSARDCRRSLACVAQICVPPATSGVDPVSGASADMSCGARGDCAPGLVCVANACRSMGVDPGAFGARVSGRGESCRAKNDCAPELSCVSGVCQAVNIPLGRTAKSCYRVECANNEDCCAGFEPNAQCDVYRENCQTDPIFCNTYRSLCECNQQCVEEQCVEMAPGCRDSAECTSLQTPYCVEGKCGECDAEHACPDANSRCVQGMCVGACSFDEQCAPLHRCQEGVCKETGCLSDRECAFMTKDPLAVCREGECRLPCSVDADCEGSEEDEESLGFEVCMQGACVFLGCESDAECRALLALDNETGGARAVCR